MNVVENEARENVERLLAMVCNDKTDPTAYEFALKELTRLAVKGTLPANSRKRPGGSTEDDESYAKERFIAP